MPDTVIADGKEQELLQILEKIFCERCGLNFHVSTKRVEPPKSKRRKNAELELEQEVAAITKHYASVKAGEQTAQAGSTEAAEEKSRLLPRKSRRTHPAVQRKRMHSRNAIPFLPMTVLLQRNPTIRCHLWP